MKKNGYTLIELLIVIVLMGVFVFFVISKTSYAFKDSSDELKKNQDTLLLRQAKMFGENSEKLKEDKEMIVMVSELVENEYLAGNDGIFYDYSGRDINDTKIKLSIDEEGNVKAEFLN